MDKIKDTILKAIRLIKVRLPKKYKVLQSMHKVTDQDTYYSITLTFIIKIETYTNKDTREIQNVIDDHLKLMGLKQEHHMVQGVSPYTYKFEYYINKT